MTEQSDNYADPAGSREQQQNEALHEGTVPEDASVEAVTDDVGDSSNGEAPQIDEETAKILQEGERLLSAIEDYNATVHREFNGLRTQGEKTVLPRVKAYAASRTYHQWHDPDGHKLANESALILRLSELYTLAGMSEEYRLPELPTTDSIYEMDPNGNLESRLVEPVGLVDPNEIVSAVAMLTDEPEEGKRYSQRDRYLANLCRLLYQTLVSAKFEEASLVLHKSTHSVVDMELYKLYLPIFANATKVVELQGELRNKLGIDLTKYDIGEMLVDEATAAYEQFRSAHPEQSFPDPEPPPERYRMSGAELLQKAVSISSNRNYAIDADAMRMMINRQK